MSANAAAQASAASKARHLVTGLRTFRNRVRNTLLANGGGCTGSSFPKAYQELTHGRQCKQDLARLGLLSVGDKLMPTVAAVTLDICEWVPDDGCGALVLHPWAARPLCPDAENCRRHDKCDYQHETGTPRETKQSDDDTAGASSPETAAPGAGLDLRAAGVTPEEAVQRRARHTLYAVGGVAQGHRFGKLYKGITGADLKADLAAAGRSIKTKINTVVAAVAAPLVEFASVGLFGEQRLTRAGRSVRACEHDATELGSCPLGALCPHQHEYPGAAEAEAKALADIDAARMRPTPSTASSEASPGAWSAEASPGAGSAESPRGGVAAARARATSAGELAAEASDSSDDDVDGAGYEDEDDGRLQRLVREPGIDDGAVPADEGEPAPPVLESYRPFDLSDAAMEALVAQVEGELQAGASGGADGASHAEAEVGRDGAHPARPSTDADAAESRVAPAAADGTDAHGDRKTEHDPTAAAVPTEVELEAVPDRSHGEPTPAQPPRLGVKALVALFERRH